MTAELELFLRHLPRATCTHADASVVVFDARNWCYRYYCGCGATAVWYDISCTPRGDRRELEWQRP